ncbi:MAG: NifB/NifX family molybdenum-iron cluster-binding protein [Desulfobacteraceae bacterium]|nr:NifB/NifX family molybdenum-iron cluster-binding protein [Desulfobacteraceae bacterium]
MKIAVTSKGKNLESPVDPRFGRAAYILIIDTDTLVFEVLDNSENMNAFKGAGIQAATLISDKGADVLLTGHCGPNAFKTLQAGGVKVVNDVEGLIGDAVTAFKDGRFTYAEDANVDGHW